jgi:aryl-alcohol dehydrogenase-like predicted oxidoreductase
MEDMMTTRRVSVLDQPTGALALGCMGMSEFYGPRDEDEAMATLARAVDLGVDHLDTADMYGFGHNEELVGRFLRTCSAKVLVATKFGITREADASAPGGYRRGVCGRPDYVTQACEASLRRLGVPVIDLYYYHRVDRSVPIEETVGAMARLVERGLVRAHAEHPIAAVQSEYSLWSRQVEADVLPLCKARGILFVAYSPLGRGFLSGRIAATSELAEDDFRRGLPRFQEENLAHNRALVEKLSAKAASLGATPGQVALAWVIAKGEHVVALFGTKRRKYLEENLGAARVRLSDADVRELDVAFDSDRVAGDRYNADGMRAVHV